MREEWAVGDVPVPAALETTGARRPGIGPRGWAMPETSPRYKWIVLAITTVGVLMVAIDTTVVILALPSIIQELHSNLVSAIWVIMSYIFVTTILLLALGRVADLYGRVRLYNWGFAIFTIGSALCGFSATDGELIAARVVQAVGGALMLVNAWAILTETFPPGQRGFAMGINSMTFGVGGIIGPVLGGLILAVASWRWVFFINIPIGVLGTVLAYHYLRETAKPNEEERLDALGAATFSICLLALLAALMLGIQLGWRARIVEWAGGAFGVTLLFFLFWERRVAFPALDVRLFRSRVFDFAVLAASFQSLALFAVQFLIVFYLQAVRGDTPLHAALLILPMPIASAITGPIGGRISDRIGARVPATLGVLLQAFGVYWLSHLTIDSAYEQIAVGLALTGLGGGLFFSPNTSAAMSTAPPERLGVAAATLATLRNVGTVMSFAVALAVAAGSIPRQTMLQIFVGTSAVHLPTPLMLAFVDGLRAALHLSVAICLVAAAMSLIRGTEVPKPRMA